MRAVYNNTLTIDTNSMDDHAALMELQKVVEGKCLVYGGGITRPEDSLLQSGVTLVLDDDPTENGEIRLEIVPDMVDGYPVIKIHCIPCEMLDDTPADSNQTAFNMPDDAKPCSVDILGISLGEEGLLIIPREVRMQCEPLVNAVSALTNALNDLPISTVDKNALAMLAANLMAQAEQEGVKNGVDAYTDFTYDMTPEKFTELEASVKGNSMPS